MDAAWNRGAKAAVASGQLKSMRSCPVGIDGIASASESVSYRRPEPAGGPLRGPAPASVGCPQERFAGGLAAELRGPAPALGGIRRIASSMTSSSEEGFTTTPSASHSFDSSYVAARRKAKVPIGRSPKISRSFSLSSFALVGSRLDDPDFAEPSKFRSVAFQSGRRDKEIGTARQICQGPRRDDQGSRICFPFR